MTLRQREVCKYHHRAGIATPRGDSCVVDPSRFSVSLPVAQFRVEAAILERPVRVDIQLYRARSGGGGGGGTFERGERGRLQGRSHGERG